MVVAPISVQRFVRFTRVVTLVSWILCSRLFSLAQAKLPDSKSPLWNQDLLPTLSRTQSGLGSAVGITFFDDARLIAYAVSQDLHQLSSRESPEVSSPFRLHVWVVDAKSGKVETEKEWGTRRYDSDVQTTTGGILVKTGGIVRLYSPDFVQARELPLTLDPNGRYFTSVSASGQTIAISHYFEKEHKWISHVDVLDANTLRVRYSWNQYPPILRFSMVDQTFATARGGVIGIAEFEHPDRSKVLLDVSQGGCAAGSGGRIVSDQLLLWRKCDEVVLLDAGGASYVLDPFNGRGSSAKLGSRCEPYFGTTKSAAASGGRFVALALPALKIKKPLLAESRTCLDGLQIAVYDVAFKKRVLTVDVDPLPKNDYDFAVSPDGSKLAILNDRKVSVYSVPVQATEHTNDIHPKNGGPHSQVPRVFRADTTATRRM